MQAVIVPSTPVTAARHLNGLGVSAIADAAGTQQSTSVEGIDDVAAAVYSAAQQHAASAEGVAETSVAIAKTHGSLIGASASRGG